MANAEYPHKNWMENLPNDLRDIPIIYLAIPGSHNSMTYGITSDSKISPDADSSVSRLYTFFPCIVRRWSITQSADVTEQLEHGVRFFDLRIATKDNTKFYFAHGLYAMEIFEPLKQINDFLTLNSEEVVILDCQHFYEFTVAHHTQFQYDLKKIFGNKLFTRVNGSLNQCTLNLCSKLKKQIIVIYRRYPTIPVEFWPEENWPTPWPNTSSITELKKYLEESLEKRKPNAGYVSQCILTPNPRYITLRFYSSLKKTACKVENNLSDWITSQHCGNSEANKPAANVFLADFVHLSNWDFCNKVIALNNISNFFPGEDSICSCAQ